MLENEIKSVKIIKPFKPVKDKHSSTVTEDGGYVMNYKKVFGVFIQTRKFVDAYYFVSEENCNAFFERKNLELQKQKDESKKDDPNIQHSERDSYAAVENNILDDVKNQLYDAIDQVSFLANQHLKNTGNTSEECQLIYIINKINSLEQAINGIDKNDLK